MTIASEITRLQNDKACICAAIENKGVTVWNVTLDDYASCIDAIQSWGDVCGFQYIVVGWGASWSTGWWGNWWGWAGDVVVGGGWFIPWAASCIDICIGAWGEAAKWSGNPWCPWHPSCITFNGATVISNWGCGSKDGWSGGWNSWSWCIGGNGMGCRCYAWWWGAWVAWNGFDWCASTWCWGLGVTYCWISFAWWGGWGWWWTNRSGACGCCGGWGWGTYLGWQQAWCPATTCGSWWGGSATCSYVGGAWWWGAVLISYPQDWSWGTKCATWWDCCFTYNWYCVHMFTSDGTFTVVS